MVSTTEVGGDGSTRNGPAARKNQSKPNNKKPVGFKGDAKAESVLHGKIITSGSNQAGQIIALVSHLSSFNGDKTFPYWVESIRLMQRKTQPGFIPAKIGRSAYGTITQACAFVWNGNVLDTEDKYKRDDRMGQKCDIRDQSMEQLQE